MLDGVNFVWMAPSGAMSGPIGNSQAEVSARLEALPRALGYPNDAAFAAAMGISPQRWNAAKMTGSLSKRLADILIQKIPGMTIEYLWYGRRPPHLASDTTEWPRRSRGAS